ncbi:unnamed protein product [Trichobilharzia szidati]|nr:unnamed protein product [Trichobilharzia szidati]
MTVTETSQGRYFDVLKKATPDGKLSLFLDRRTFIDHFDHVDPIDGILTISEDVMGADLVFLILTCSYRYGRDDLDVLGLTFQKELLIYTKRVWPDYPIDEVASTMGDKKWTKKWKKIKRLSKKGQESSEQMSMSVVNDDPYGIFSDTLKDSDLAPFQTKLVSKYGRQAVPFRIILPTSSPSSVAIQPLQDDGHKLYGISYGLTAFIGRRIDNTQPASSTVTIILRKYFAGPELIHRPIYPVAESIRKTINFACHSGELSIAASIEKPLYFHDESLSITILLDNLCSMPVRKLHISLVQIAEMFLLTKGTFRSVIDEHFCKENLPHAGQQEWKYTTTLTTSLTDKMLKHGVALEGYIKQEKNWLASSTILKLSADLDECLEIMQNVNRKIEENTEIAIKANKELHGIVISYCVRVRCWVGISRCSLYIPFLLMRPGKEPCNTTDAKCKNSTTSNPPPQAEIIESQAPEEKPAKEEVKKIEKWRRMM